MTRATEIEALADHGSTMIYDLTPLPLTAAGSGPWRRQTGTRPGWVDVHLSAGTASFVYEVTNNPNDANGTPVFGTDAEPATITGTNAKTGFIPYSGALYGRLRRTDSAGGDLSASLAYA